MPNIKRSISVTDQQHDWIKAKVEAGQFGNESEVYRTLIRKAQDEENKLAALRARLDEGEADIEAGRYTALNSDTDVDALFDGIRKSRETAQ